MNKPLNQWSILLLTCLFFSLFNCEQETDQPPNIVFLFADDQTFNTIHALGNSTIHTPNLDRLAAGGTTFTHAYNMGGWHGAICVASRSMIISGAYLWDAQSMAEKWRNGDSTALKNTWGQWMSNAGYDTYMSGKWHVAAPADVVFDTAAHVRPGMPRDLWNTMTEAGKRQLRTQPNEQIDLASIMPPGYHRPTSAQDTSWSPTDPKFGGFWQGGKHWSEVLKDDALYFIQQAEAKKNPFFMYLAFNAPHDPRQSPQSFLDQYPLDSIEVPKNALPEYPYKDSIGNSPGLRDEALAPYPRTAFAVKTHIKEYYAIISHLDEQIGKVLDALEATGQMDNTYIFFTADHGLAVGQHGFIGKQNMYDHSMRVPLIVAGPDIPDGQRIDHEVYLQDLMPTALELAHIQQPEQVAFHSLLKLAQGAQTTSSYPAIYGAYMDLQRMIRKDDFKLIVYPKIKKMRLFDLDKDPLEMHDLADDPAYENKVDMLFQALLNLQETMKDTLDLKSIFDR